MTAPSETARAPRLLAELGEHLVGELDLAALAERMTGAIVPALAQAAAVYWDEPEPDDGFDREEDQPRWRRLAGAHAAGEAQPWSDPSIEAQLVAACQDSVASGAPRSVTAGPLAGRVLPLALAPGARGALVLLQPAPERSDDADGSALVAEVTRRASLALAAALRHRQATRKIAARDELIAMLSHDLRNALGTASMNCQLLSARWVEHPGGPPRRNLDAIRRSVDWMTELVDDLLDHRALEQQGLAIERRALDPLALCREAIGLHESTVQARELRVVVDDAASGAWVLGDRTRIIQVIDNLLANALAVSPAHTEVVVRLEQLGERVRFSIRDAGPAAALRPNEAAALFRGTLRRPETRGKTSGLGLVIAHGLARALGGRIWMESQPGVGSVFCFTLERAEPA